MLVEGFLDVHQLVRAGLTTWPLSAERPFDRRRSSASIDSGSRGVTLCLDNAALDRHLNVIAS